ncbi:hypothetical protein [Rhizobium jaguaris]|nr:hypothetical protein [Rhizobium jaguaris]
MRNAHTSLIGEAGIRRAVVFVLFIIAAVYSQYAMAGAWSYHQDSDKMRGTTTYYATLRSDNEVDFSFPYQGGSHGTLGLRTDGGHKLDAYLMVSKGQFMCSSLDEDIVAVKFDDGPVQNFRCSRSDDGSSDVIFLNDEVNFLTQLKSASKLIIEARFFQEGTRQFVFDVTGLHQNLRVDGPPAKDATKERAADIAAPKIKALMAEDLKWQMACRGPEYYEKGSKVCENWDKVRRKLRRAGWCFGPAEVAEANQDWMLCRAGD